MTPVRALLLPIVRNLRRRPGQAVAMLLLTALAAVPLDLGWTTVTRVPDLVSQRMDQANASDAVTLAPADRRGKDLADLLRSRPEVADVETQRVLAGTVETTYAGEASSIGVILYDADSSPRYDRPHPVSSLGKPVADPVIAPAVLGSAGGYALGDTLTLTGAGSSLTFRISGFAEVPMMGMPTMGFLAFGVPAEEMAALEADPGPLQPMSVVKARAAGGGDALEILVDAVSAFNAAHPDAPMPSVWEMSRTLVETGAMVGANIFAAALGAFALIVAGVALVVIRFLAVAAVDGDLRRLAVLRALGFTTGQIIAQLALASGACAALGSLTGVGLAQAALPVLTSAITDQTGLIWTAAPAPEAAAATFLLLTGLALATSALSAARLRRLTTLTALRGGTRAHEPDRNPVPLAGSRGPANLVLGAKAALGNLSHGVLVAVTMLVVTALSIISASLAVNVLGNPLAFSHLVVGDLPDLVVEARDTTEADRIESAAAGMPGVEGAFRAVLTGASVNDINASLFVAEDFTHLRADPTFQGRMPRHDNEVALGATMARLLDAEVGEEITLRLDGGEAAYVVSGLTSTARGLGKSVDLTIAGMRRADPGYRPASVSLNLAPGASASELADRLQADLPGAVASVEDQRASLQTQLAGYESMVGRWRRPSSCS